MVFIFCLTALKVPNTQIVKTSPLSVIKNKSGSVRWTQTRTVSLAIYSCSKWNTSISLSCLLTCGRWNPKRVPTLPNLIRP